MHRKVVCSTVRRRCMRVARPMELAEYLLCNQSSWSRDAIVRSVGRTKEQSVTLHERVRVPVHLLY